MAATTWLSYDGDDVTDMAAHTSHSVCAGKRYPVSARRNMAQSKQNTNTLYLTDTICHSQNKTPIPCIWHTQYATVKTKHQYPVSDAICHSQNKTPIPRIWQTQYATVKTKHQYPVSDKRNMPQSKQNTYTLYLTDAICHSQNKTLIPCIWRNMPQSKQNTNTLYLTQYATVKTKH